MTDPATAPEPSVDRPAELAVTPTVVKHYFQYRCDRQARYLMCREPHPIQVPPKPAGRWADEGTGFEVDVVAVLASKHPVLRLDGVGWPQATGRFLAFLRRETDHRFACQCALDLTDDEDLRSRWGLPDGLRAGRGRADLVRADPGPVFRVIDVKHAQRATAFHRAQVAAYALFLARLLERHGIPGRVDDVGEIWHARPAAGGVEWEPAEFRLGGYAAQVEEFFRTTAPRLAAVAVTADRDDSFFHLSYKCEPCRYLPHCGQAVSAEKPAAAWDPSAVPGLSQQGKRTLLQLGIRTVSGLAGENLASAAGANWSLRQNAELVALRAAALASGRLARLPRRYTYAMPGEFDLAVVLAADSDPIEGRLAAVGCLCEWGAGPTARRELTVEPIGEAGEGPEREAILKVLGAVVESLDAADRHNAAGDQPPIRAHLFVYESSEAADLRAALGRHLGDEAVRTGLLHMLRVFPPDEVPPEPEYRGAQHLPATALRAVLDELYALPVKVAHDLRSVTAALASADPPLAEPYTPGPRFARPFSSRLNIDACRDLKAGTLAPAEVADDLARRLRATAALARWLAADNRVARGDAAPNFLRLAKKPFRWQATFHPLDAGDLDLVRAQELLDRRCRELDALSELARPWEQRRDRFRCLARMRLVGEAPPASRWVERRLVFAVPQESARAELAGGDVGLILTNDDPDLRLDPTLWPELFVDLDRVTRKGDGAEAVIDVRDVTPLVQRLLDETPDGGWFLDKAYLDLTGDKMDDFLDYLGGAGKGATP